MDTASGAFMQAFGIMVMNRVTGSIMNH